MSFTTVIHDVETAHTAECAAYAALGAWPIAAAPPPDACLRIDDGATPIARASLWWSATASFRGARTGYVGHFAARDADAGAACLRAAVAAFPTDVASVVGPLDGSTWHRYRAVTDAGSRPPFPLEPTNPAWWPDAFRAAEWTALETYWSAARDLRAHPIDAATHDAAAPDVPLRSLDPAALDRDLDALYDLAVTAFAANPLYTPIPRAAFRAQYRPIAAQLPADAVRLVTAPDGTLGALALSIPADSETIIIKTLAVADALRGRGIGSWLLDDLARRAMARGATTAIYALMHDANRSSSLVRRRATCCRRYALFGLTRS